MVLKIQTFLKRVVNDFVVNAIGFQGINCPSYIYFNQKKNNSNNFIIALCYYQMKRIKNIEIINILYDIVTDPKIDITNVKLELLKEYAKEEDFNKIFDNQDNLLPKKLSYYCKKYKINKHKINNRQRKHLEYKLYNKKLIKIIKK